MTFRQRIGSVMVESPVLVVASATIEKGASMNRVRVKKVQKPKKGRGRHKAPPGEGPFRQVLISIPASNLFLLDSFAEAANLSRSQLVQRVTSHIAGEGGFAPIGKGARVCLSLTTKTVALLDAQAEAAGMSRSAFVRAAFAHYAGCVGSPPR